MKLCVYKRKSGPNSPWEYVVSVVSDNPVRRATKASSLGYYTFYEIIRVKKEMNRLFKKERPLDVEITFSKICDIHLALQPTNIGIHILSDLSNEEKDDFKKELFNRLQTDEYFKLVKTA